MDRTERRKLVREMVEGRVITSMHTGVDLCLSVFMPLAFLDDEQRKETVAQLGEKGFVYEYVDAAPQGGMCVNGYPIFWSMRVCPEKYAGSVLRRVRRRAWCQKQWRKFFP